MNLKKHEKDIVKSWRKKFKKKYTNEQLLKAIEYHRLSDHHKTQLETSEKCGCFYCKEIFNPKEIESWCDEADAEECTAICPYCNIDSILPESSLNELGAKLDKKLLKFMSELWFSTI